jgi:hypothetical protein
MKKDFVAFQEFFKMQLFQWKRILMQQSINNTKKRESYSCNLGTANCSYFDGKELHQKYNH